MNIIISNSTGQPIYEQIVCQIRNQIFTNVLAAGEALPSMRLLAKELKVSVITTKRAYDELEKENLIESYTGKGSFVKSHNPEQLKSQHLHEIRLKLNEVLELAQLSGITLTDIVKLLEELKTSNDTIKHLEKGE